MVRALSVAVLLILVVIPLLAALPALFFAGQGSGIRANWSLWLVPVSQTVLLTISVTLLVLLSGLVIARHIGKSRGFAVISVLLSTPHVAFAVGIMLLLSPSGYLTRLVHTLLHALPTPPVGWPLPEKSVLTLAIVLLLKEIPFLLLIASTQLRQLPYQQWLLQAQSLGWSGRRAWWLLVVPALLPRLKLALAAIVIYTLSVVDIPLLLGPNMPGVLATVVYQQHYQWGADNQAAIGVWWLLLLSAVMFLLLQGLLSGYPPLARLARSHWQKTSRRRWHLSAGKGFLQVGAGLSLLVLAALLMESFAGARFYPALWPQQWQASRWLTEWPYIWPLLLTSGWLALISAALATAAAIAVLERQRRTKSRSMHWLPLLMLFIPQLVLVLGWQKVTGAGSSGPVLIWSHVVFCFPYAYLVLHGAWVNVSDRWLYQAQSLGYSYRQAWWQVLLPMLKHAVFSAFAVAFSVSIAQYLPTLWLAGGTLPTITTEAVSIASGGDWRLASLYALMQALLPLVMFTLLLGRKPRQQAIDVTH